MNYLYLLTMTLAVASRLSSAEFIDGNSIDVYCYPEQLKDSRRTCECHTDSAPPLGTQVVHVDCSFKDLKSTDLSEVLPLHVDILDLSWNSLETLLIFSSESLVQLNVMHNNISSVARRNFAKLSNLRELFLNWNSIQTIELGAFEGLANLQVLDLSHNNLHALSPKLFAPLVILDALTLSWNRILNQTAGLENTDFYQTFGVNVNLRILKLEACSLNNLMLADNAKLIELSMRRNALTIIPANLPSSIEKLDISDNLFEVLQSSDTAGLSNVQELYVEDMPRLQAIEENALLPLKSLKKVSFQNSRRLTSFNAHGFGFNTTQWPPLQSMIFRGTSLRTFNATLSPVFHKLTELDLNGMPLHCDCELIWVKELKLETNGRCFKPSRLRGMRLTDTRVSDLSCDTWSHWVYGLIILGLLILSSAGLYFIVVGLRPNNKVTMRRKVGAGSPYARVTIEPNRQENNHF